MTKATNEQIIERELVIHAYAQGFVAGAESAQFGKQRRHPVDSQTHQHWRQGYEDGRIAIDHAVQGYRERIEHEDPPPVRKLPMARRRSARALGR